MNFPELEDEVIKLKAILNILLSSYVKVDPDILKKIQEGTKPA